MFLKLLLCHSCAFVNLTNLEEKAAQKEQIRKRGWYTSSFQHYTHLVNTCLQLNDRCSGETLYYPIYTSECWQRQISI